MNRSFTLVLLIFSAAQTQAQFDGFALYNRLNQTTSYLIDADGGVAHSWSCPTTANYAMALKENGNIVRGARYTGNVLNGAAVGGMVQELDPEANVVWEFVYSTSNYVTHHDLCLMPNGNVLLTAWFVQSNAQLQTLGYTGNSAKWPTRIIEIQPQGSGAQIVWEWNMLDRFIQYVDPLKPDYLPIAEHPERMNINVVTNGSGGPGGSGDWFHVNGIDYNPELDQIAFSSRYLSEIFIIDHSTTTEEAAGHTAGNAGKGGDFLYRWGNPANYGAPGSQTIAGAVHDVRWIKPGRPDEGFLQFVNNVGGPGNSTVIDAIDPPLDGFNYTLVPGSAYGPSIHDWRHQALANASGQSASDRMPNGNVFVALSDEYMYEVDVNGTLVWQYNAGPAKAFRYLCEDPGIIALLGDDPCDLGTGIAGTQQTQLRSFPNPTTGLLNLSGIPLQDQSTVEVFDAVGMILMSTGPSRSIDLSGSPDGMYLVKVVLTSGERVTERIAVQH